MLVFVSHTRALEMSRVSDMWYVICPNLIMKTTIYVIIYFQSWLGHTNIRNIQISKYPRQKAAEGEAVMVDGAGGRGEPVVVIMGQ